MNALEERILELIGEDPASPDVFVDTDEGMAPIRDSINDAVQEIVMLTGAFKRQVFIPLREQTPFYRLRLSNGELGWITDAWLVNQKRRLEQTDLIRLTAHNPRWMVPASSPESYLPVGADYVGFYPKPASDSDVVELTVVEIPSAYSTGRDRVKLRDAFQFATVNYAVAEFWASRGDAAEAQKHLALYMDALGLKQAYVAQQGDTRRFETRKDPPGPTA